MRISDWSSDVCSSDLLGRLFIPAPYGTSEKRENHGWTSSRLIFAQIPTEGRFRCCSCLARADELVDQCILQYARNISLEERRVGQDGFSTCRSRRTPYH